jgi:hypothetical protein
MTDSKYTLKLSRDILNEFFENEFAFHRLPRERISDLLLAQLYVCRRLRIHSIFYITDEIKYLEGITRGTRTGKERAFTGDLLKGLWKKHFYSDRFIARNLANYLSSKKGKKAFDNYAREAFSENEGDFIEEKTLNKIGYFVTFGALKDKASCSGQEKDALTGEWIIFGKCNGQNYYLCIANHDEGDQRIRNTILSMCPTQFPFLSAGFA